MIDKKVIILIVGLVVIASVSFIYFNLIGEKIDDNNNSATNLTKDNNTNVSNLNNDTTMKNSSIINSKDKDKNNIPSSNVKVPKNSKLTQSKAFNLAQKQAKGVFASSDVKVYVKYIGSGYTDGKFYWDFAVYKKKDNKYLGTFSIEDSTGKATII